jgi:alpha-L-fucosidase
MPASFHDSAEVMLVFPHTRTMNCVMLQEQIAVGQRIEEWRLDLWDGHAWSVAARGTTVGYKRLVRFPERSASRARLVIMHSRSLPTLSTIALYDVPEEMSR